MQMSLKESKNKTTLMPGYSLWLIRILSVTETPYNFLKTPTNDAQFYETQFETFDI